MMELATIPKNSREEIRLSVEAFQGHQIVNLRVWFRASDGEFRPSRKGIAFKLDLLPEVMAALAKVGKGGDAC